MPDNMIELTQKRRSIYALNKDMPFDNAVLEKKIEAVLKDMPSAFNSQSARLVLLLGEHHQSLWQLTAAVLQKVVPPAAFTTTAKKIDSFTAAYGTLLFFEDEATIRHWEKQFPTYAEQFPAWSEQGNGMLQFGIWAMFAEYGIGASLQHYNPLIDQQVHETWNLPPQWQLKAQMPFGGIAVPAAVKSYLPLSERFRVFQ